MKRVDPSRNVWRQAVLCAFAAAVVFAAAAVAQTEEPPADVRQLLPRGEIPAVFEPVFVTADEAEMPDSAWVLGVYLDGEARAYDLNLLNHHEVVNDVVGGRPVAPVW
jgi:hypothetical protein